MKRMAFLVAFAGLSAFPASAGSIELIDATITGPVGTTKSMIVLGPTELCAPNCGGDGIENIVTSSFDAMAVPGRRKINVDFARKFPDPSVPVPAPMSAEGDGSGGGMPGMPGMGGAAAPAPTPPAPEGAAAAPSAPADAGTIPAQPPVGQSSLRQTGTGEMLKEPGVPKGKEEAAIRANGAPQTGG
jgi:hypothetical protein